jgi:hypothetical protein
MDADDVKFVVPTATSGSSAHYVYLHDGRIVRINPASGKVLGVAMLPSEAVIKESADRGKQRRGKGK